jgi:hypothetical protein
MALNDFTDQNDSAGDELAGVLSPMSDEAKAAAKARRNQIVLAALVLVGVGVGVKQFVLGGGGPKSAAAATVVAPGGAGLPVGLAKGGKGSAVEQFLAGGAGDMKAARELMRHTEQVVQTFKTYPSVNQVPLDNLKVNPFQEHAGVKGAESDEEAKARKAQERAEALAAAQQLQLQSVLHSKVAPACLMNNTLLRERQSVNGFVVERINPKSVIVHRGIYRFEVRLLR